MTAADRRDTDGESPTAIHHFGPDPAFVGGMQSMLRVVADCRICGDVIVLHPTWTPRTAMTLAHSFRALRAAATVPRAAVAHVHLSYGGSFVREGAIIALLSRRGIPTV